MAQKAKHFKTRVQNKHATEAQWREAINFIPLAGELIIYDIDDTHSSPRFKIGDGIVVWNDEHTEYTIIGTKINDLPFTNNIETPDWNQNDATQPDYIKNRTHYVADAIHPDIEWDGRPEGKTYFIVEQYENSSVYCAKVSDKIFTREELLETEVITKNGEEIFNTIITEEIQWQEIPGALVTELMLLIINNAQEFQNTMIQNGIIFPSDFSEGLYLMGVREGLEPVRYVSNMNFPQDIQEIDKKFLPNSNITNSGKHSLSQIQDTAYTGIAIKTKNPNAYALDNTLTDNEPIGATGAFASSFGGTSSAQGKRSLAEGTNTVAKGKYSHVEGDNSVALGNDSHAEGLNCVSFGSGSHSEGGSTQAIGMHAHSEGVNTVAIGDASHTGGSGSTANGTHSFAHGNNVIAGYDNQFVVGRFNNNHSDSIFEVGLGSDDTNRTTCFYISQNNGAAYSNFSNGYSPVYDPNRYATQSEVSQAITTEVPVIGGSTTLNAVALRNGQSSALYDGCVALGAQTTASGNASAAFNSNTQATGNNSCAIGRQTIASGSASHSQGYATQAKGDYSHAEGVNTIAEGANSHAEGDGSYAKGAHSHAQGNNTQALADNSSAAGNRTIAGYANQFIVGKFNDNKSDTFFEIGNGADDSNRSNAFEVYADGHAEISVMGSTEKSVTTKKYVDDKIAEMPSGGAVDDVQVNGESVVDEGVANIVVDQTYTSDSENAQSGKAVAEAINEIDDKKVNKILRSDVTDILEYDHTPDRVPYMYGVYGNEDYEEQQGLIKGSMGKLRKEMAAQIEKDDKKGAKSILSGVIPSKYRGMLDPYTVAIRDGNCSIPVGYHSYDEDKNGNIINSKLYYGAAVPYSYVDKKAVTSISVIENQTYEFDWNAMYFMKSNTNNKDIEILDGNGNRVTDYKYSYCLLILPKESFERTEWTVSKGEDRKKDTIHGLVAGMSDKNALVDTAKIEMLQFDVDPTKKLTIKPKDTQIYKIAF